MPRFDTVRSGDPLKIPAATYNELLQMLIWWRGQGPAQRGGGGPLRELDVIRLQNTSGEALSAFHVLGLGDPVISPDDNLPEFQFRLAIQGETPQRADHYRRFAVLLEPAAEDQVVAAAVDGVVACLLDVADEHHTHADVVDDETLLQTGVCGGAEILWKESGVGEKWGLVRLGAPKRTAIAKAAAEIEALEGSTPGVGEVTEWTFDGDNLVASSLTFDAYNLSEAEVSADKFLQLKEIGDRMAIDFESCGGEESA